MLAESGHVEQLQFAASRKDSISSTASTTSSSDEAGMNKPIRGERDRGWPEDCVRGAQSLRDNVKGLREAADACKSASPHPGERVSNEFTHPDIRTTDDNPFGVVQGTIEPPAYASPSLEH